jgi:hypothetical protein
LKICNLSLGILCVSKCKIISASLILFWDGLKASYQIMYELCLTFCHSLKI